MRWRFVGLWDLLPVYEELADGNELFWTDHGMLAADTARRRCLTRAEALEKDRRNGG